MVITLLPAYGRQYNTKKEVLADYHNNCDFRTYVCIGMSVYINKQDIIREYKTLSKTELIAIKFAYGKLSTKRHMILLDY